MLLLKAPISALIQPSLNSIQVCHSVSFVNFGKVLAHCIVYGVKATV